MNYDTGTFTPLHDFPLDYGFHFYAPQTFRDGKGRRILIAWMNMWETKMPSQAHGWAGAMTIPRELSPSADGKLIVQPVEELKLLRSEHIHIGRTKVERDSENILSHVKGKRFEIILEVEGTFEAIFGLKSGKSAEGDEETVVLFDGVQEEVIVDLTIS